MEKLNQSQLIPVIIILIAAILGAFAQYFFKLGSLKILEIPIYRNWFFLIGLVSFFWVLVLMTLSFRLGGEMMIIYPSYGSTYIWSLCISHFLEKNPVNHFQILGVLLIILGIGFISQNTIVKI